MSSGTQLPPVTIVIEWENAIDVEDDWTEKAMSGLQRELESVASRLTTKPHVTYLYNERVVDPEAIRRVIAKAAPRPRTAELESRPSGLTCTSSRTSASRDRRPMFRLCSIATLTPAGWLEGLLKPFADPTIMAVGGSPSLAMTTAVEPWRWLIFDLQTSVKGRLGGINPRQ
jgi:hypothetical protein